MTATTTQSPAFDTDRFDQIVGTAVVEAGATMAAGLVVIGSRLGLYAALADGPLTTTELAGKTDTFERYVREWASAQAAGGYVTYYGDGRFGLSPEQALALDPDGPVNLAAMFKLAVDASSRMDPLEASMRTGEPVAWRDLEEALIEDVAEFYKTGYRTHLVADWIPALDGVAERLSAGARVADVGCGYGITTVLLAEAFPASTFHGFDYHEESIVESRAAAIEAGVSDRASFEVSDATDFPALGFDLVCTFDALHDYGQPLAAARRVRETLVPGGSWMIVEPRAGDSLEENLNPVGRMFYSGSTYTCVPNALSQDGAGLGAQAGPAAIGGILAEAGFGEVAIVAQTPFNDVYQARV